MKEYIERLCEEHKHIIEEVGTRIWEYAELSLEEYESSIFLVEFLQKNGYEIIMGIGGFPTGFVGEFITGDEYSIGLMCEYDALPGLGDENGRCNGHGCGHNLFAAGALATAIVLKKIFEEQNIKGKIKIFGCPGEEEYGAKPFFAKQGYFSGLDCIFGFHPLEFNGVLFAQHNALKIKEYKFYGKSSHAGAEPHLGISALDAVEVMNVTVNYLREHIESSARIHYIIKNGGQRPNIVPDFASSLYNIRAQSINTLEEIEERIDKIAQGVAYAIGCTLEIEDGESYVSTVVNIPLAKLAYKNLQIYGAPKFTQEEKEYIKEIGVDGFLDEDIEELPKTIETYAASTDEGDASYFAPWVRICTACIAKGTPGHSIQVVKQTNKSFAFKGMLQTVKITCGTILELINNKDNLKDIKTYHEKAVKNINYSLKNKIPNPKKFKKCKGVELNSNYMIVDIDENPLIKCKKEQLNRIKVYSNDNLVGQGEKTDENKIFIEIRDKSNEEVYTIKYVLKDEKEVLWGYFY